MTNKQRHGWYLFDFANSILIINGGLYFPQWIVSDHNIPDLVYNLVIVAVSATVFATSPLVGAVADHLRRYFHLLRIISVTMFLAATVLGILPVVSAGTLLLPALALTMFFIIMYGYQVSLAIYNATLATVGLPREHPRISGYGLAYGWLGGVVGILVVLPFVEGYIPFPFESGRQNAFLPSAFLYGVLTFLSLYLIGHENASTDGTRTEKFTGLSLYHSVLSELKRSVHDRSLLYFLLCYVLFAEAVLTIQNNVTIFLGQVHDYDDSTIAAIFLIILLGSAVGGIASGILAHRYRLTTGLLLTLLGWAIVVSGFSIADDKWLILGLFAMAGVLFGSLWNLARVLFLRLIPNAKRGIYFGVYSSLERATSLIGPMLWSAPLILIAGELGYRSAMAFMAVLLLGSIVALNAFRGTWADASG